ncbi:hypothetical protein J1N35_002739 [Gossypium stocksii]|uniref:F-box domain-containing protein n=1 Tax=Gossypium stocksii TaxID=47602 RepID=A0A9D3WN98_9ROSI|nr:hypothetical protein J1N35_002739 [Gossypium stocksii]
MLDYLVDVDNENLWVVQFFSLETVGFRSKRRNSVIVTTSPPTEDALIATEPLTKQDLVGYLASGCLPDAIALRCLARVPFYLYPKLELVSCSWRGSACGSELFKARQKVGSAEELLCVCAYNPCF